MKPKPYVYTENIERYTSILWYVNYIFNKAIFNVRDSIKNRNTEYISRISRD